MKATLHSSLSTWYLVVGKWKHLESLHSINYFSVRQLLPHNNIQQTFSFIQDPQNKDP